MRQTETSCGSQFNPKYSLSTKSEYIFQNRLDWLWTTQREDPEIKSRLQLSAEAQGTCSVCLRKFGSQKPRRHWVRTQRMCLHSEKPGLLNTKGGLERQAGKTRASKSRKLGNRGEVAEQGSPATSGTASARAWQTPRSRRPRAQSTLHRTNPTSPAPQLLLPVSWPPAALLILKKKNAHCPKAVWDKGSKFTMTYSTFSKIIFCRDIRFTGSVKIFSSSLIQTDTNKIFLKVVLQHGKSAFWPALTDSPVSVWKN